MIGIIMTIIFGICGRISPLLFLGVIFIGNCGCDRNNQHIGSNLSLSIPINHALQGPPMFLKGIVLNFTKVVIVRDVLFNILVPGVRVHIA